jgi:uncharacterized protein
VTTPIDEFGDYAALDPFFRIMEEGLAGYVDDRHFFDLLAEDVIFEYVISVPGYARRVEGRRAVAELYRGYGSNMVLRSADELAVHRDREASVIVLEYAMHGQAVQTGRTYDNDFVSVITSRTAKGRTGGTAWTPSRSSTSERFVHHEQGAYAIALILIVEPCGSPWSHGHRDALLADQLHAGLVQAHLGPPRIVWPRVDVQHVFHVVDKLAAGRFRQAVALLQPWLQFVFSVSAAPFRAKCRSRCRVPQACQLAGAVSIGHAHLVPDCTPG